eukprot:172959-Hanusia_phi.AAC.1
MPGEVVPALERVARVRVRQGKVPTTAPVPAPVCWADSPHGECASSHQAEVPTARAVSCPVFLVPQRDGPVMNLHRVEPDGAAAGGGLSDVLAQHLDPLLVAVVAVRLLSWCERVVGLDSICVLAVIAVGACVSRTRCCKVDS